MERVRRGRELLPRWILGGLLFILTLFAFNPSANAAVTGKIAGIVVDAGTGEPLPGANVVIQGTEMGAACDADGYFFIINVSPDEYDVQARMMGYKTVTQTGVRVSTDHTTNIKFGLETTVIEGEGITVQAERELIKMDVSSSQEVAWAEEIEETPLVTDIREYVNMQSGVQDWRIREGSADQTQFMVDGLMMVDNRLNRPLLTPNLSSIKEVSIVKGGFNAEYGNVRSGLINVVSKEGSPEAYHGSINFRWTPAHLKHKGPSLFDNDNYYLYPYLSEDDSVCWIGIDAAWGDSTKDSYDTVLYNKYSDRAIPGWIAVAAANDDSVTPEDLRNVFIYQHTADGCEELGQRPRTGYGQLPEWMVDAGFGGPVIPGYKDLTFFFSHRTNKETYRWPTSKDYFSDMNSMLKLNYRLNQNIKIGIMGIYREINTVDKYPMSIGDIGSIILWNANDRYASSGTDLELDSEGELYWPMAVNPFDVTTKAGGFSLDHSISPNTFYSIRITRQQTENYAPGPPISEIRDTTYVDTFGTYKVTELPYGWWSYGQNRRWESLQDQIHFNIGNGSNARDLSDMITWNFKADITTQINKYNEIKVGLEYNDDRFHTFWGYLGGEMWNDPLKRYPLYLDMGLDSIQKLSLDAWVREWDVNPRRIEGYVQDKIEFQGMIANLGIRIMYFDPNTDWYAAEPYSEYFEPANKYFFEDSTPKEPTETKISIAPRLGISHPISEVSKIYFNYGQFYSMGPSSDLYTVGFGPQIEGVTFLGNPNAEFPRTIAYELGYDHEIADQYLVRLSAFYKDIDNQISYDSIHGDDVDYTVVSNRNYEDIRGYEIGLRKIVGRWVTGWVNYTYTVSSSGYTGREIYYEDPSDEAQYGMQDPEQVKNLARPRINAKLSIISPVTYGTLLGDWRLTFYSTWEAGEYFAYNPLGIGGIEGDEFKNNAQWKPYKRIDLQLSKSVRFGGSSLELFVDVYNLLDWEYIDLGGFAGSIDLSDETANTADFKNYLKSLRLPIYGEGGYADQYEAEGYIAGNDKIGDLASDDKPYINMPDIGFRTFLEPRTVTFGVRVSF